MPTVEQLRQRLIGKLKELFQLDQPDLDFGFWRIMHAKAKQVTEFLEKDLLTTAAEAFGQGSEARIAQLREAYEDGVAQAKEFGAPDPEAAEPVKRAKAALDAAADTSKAEAEVYDHLYRFFERYYDNGDFISLRYLTRETPSKAAPYAIPYSGEEVKLHWANHDQYYIKTAEHFANFTFDLTQAPEIQEHAGELFAGQQPDPRRIHFVIVEATEGEHGNVKDPEQTKRYFVVHHDDPAGFDEAGELVCRFQFRPDPEKTGQENTWRDKRNAEAVELILNALAGLAKRDQRAAGYLDLLRIPAPTAKQKDRPLLAKYVNRYTARNTMDYFIHKDLGGFLRRELDFYIKNEVMHLDDIESADAPRAQQYLDRIRVLRQIAHKLIDFLAQLEDFQKKLWLKKKFVIETNYCITLDRIYAIEEKDTRDWLLAQIAACDAQREEWVRLFAINEIKGDMNAPGYSEPLTLEFLAANSNLIVDTRHFGQPFATQLLQADQARDARQDGIMLHAENLQAVNLIGRRYRDSLPTIYIDPPYNTDAAPILYKNGYKSSSWASLMADRLMACRPLLTATGVICVAIDDEQQRELSYLLGDVFDGNLLGTICVRANPSGRPTKAGYSVSHEYLLFAGRTAAAGIGRMPPTKEQMARFSQRDADGPFEWRNLRREGSNSDRSARRALYYPIYVTKTSLRVPGMSWDDEKEEWIVQDEPHSDEQVVYPTNEAGDEKTWRWEHTTVSARHTQLTVRQDRSGRDYPYYKRRPHEQGVVSVSSWFDAKYSATEHGTALLKAMFGRNAFSYPKSLYAVTDAIYVGGGVRPDATVLDFFAGSGTTAHAVVALNRNDSGQRKYVLAEMGEYFDTILLPRVKKCVYSEKWSEGLPNQRDTGLSHSIEYLRLESYEDCLNNLELTEDKDREAALERSPELREDYFLRYMLDVETRGSRSLLNIDAFADPTAYKLKVKKPGSDEYEWKKVDLLETFNFLIGLRVEHIAAPQTFTALFKREPDPELPEDQHTKLVLDGKLKQNADGPWWFRKVEGWVPAEPDKPDGPREKVLIVWRKLTGDIEQDNLLLDEWFQANRINTRDFEFDTIYVNGSNNLPNLRLEGDEWKVRLIEEDFFRLMWDVEDV